MDVRHYLRVAPMINDCPSCGSESVRNGEGTLKLEDNIIERTCKCGFKISYDMNRGTTRKKIKSAIEDALNKND